MQARWVLLGGTLGLGMALACLACDAMGIPAPVIPALAWTPPSAPVAPAPAATPVPATAPDDTRSPEAAPAELLDTWSLAAREDGEACREALKADGFTFRAYADRTQREKSGCGIPHGVVVSKGPSGASYDPPITVDCSLARALTNVERIVQEEAEIHLQSKIARIVNLGGFACRPRNGRKGGALSAHAFGSALDVSAFHPAKGPPVIIARDYAEAANASPARDSRRAFLHAVYGRLRREADLTYAIGPDFNAQHHDHFHLDRGGWHFWFNR